MSCKVETSPGRAGRTQAAGQSPGPAPLAFVVCPSYHGATLLALLLNNHPMITALGDTNPTREFDQTCACGRQVSQCPFWEAVRQGVGTGRFDHLHNLLPILPAPLENRPLNGGSVTVSRNAPLNRLAGRAAAVMADTVLPVAWRLRHKPVEDYIETWHNFYGLIRELHGTSMVVDGSKSSRKVSVMADAWAGQADLRVIHLVRDPRGFVASARRVDPGAEPRALAWLWSDQNRQIEKLSLSVPYLRVRYEDLAQDPEEQIGPIFDFLALPREPVVCAPRFPEKHHLMGNAMMFKFTGEVRLDERWRKELTAAAQRQVVRHATQSMARYGYR